MATPRSRRLSQCARTSLRPVGSRWRPPSATERLGAALFVDLGLGGSIAARRFHLATIDSSVLREGAREIAPQLDVLVRNVPARVRDGTIRQPLQDVRLLWAAEDPRFCVFLVEAAAAGVAGMSLSSSSSWSNVT